MEKWEVSSFEKLYAIPSRNGLSKPSRVRGSGYKMINMGELFSNDRIYNIDMELVPLTDAEKEKARVLPLDLLFARQSLVAAGAGKCSVVMETSDLTVFESHLIRVRLNKSIADPFFYYYYFKSSCSPMQTIIQHCVQAGIKASDLSRLEVAVPPICEQHKIASVLMSLDDKIEENKKINKNLEQQAQAIYSNLFIEQRQESWNIGQLSDLISVKYGKDHKKLADGSYPVYGSGGIMRYVEKPLYTGESVLIPRKGTLNNVMYVNGAFWSVDTMFYTEMLRPNIAKFVYHFVKSKDLVSLNAGSAVPSMTTNILNAMQLYIPDEKSLEKFENIVSPMYRAMQENTKESKILVNTRDTLLPKLMSGELDVSDIDL